MNKRVKQIRTKLQMSQDEFAHRLGVTRSAISYIESGRSSVTDSMARLICKEFDVDYFWLTEGADVPMFRKLPKSTVDLLSQEYDLSPEERYLLDMYLDLDREDRIAIKKILKKVLKKAD